MTELQKLKNRIAELEKEIQWLKNAAPKIENHYHYHYENPVQALPIQPVDTWPYRPYRPYTSWAVSNAGTQVTATGGMSVL